MICFIYRPLITNKSLLTSPASPLQPPAQRMLICGGLLARLIAVFNFCVACFIFTNWLLLNHSHRWFLFIVNAVFWVAHTHAPAKENRRADEEAGYSIRSPCDGSDGQELLNRKWVELFLFFILYRLLTHYFIELIKQNKCTGQGMTNGVESAVSIDWGRSGARIISGKGAGK